VHAAPEVEAEQRQVVMPTTVLELAGEKLTDARTVRDETAFAKLSPTYDEELALGVDITNAKPDRLNCPVTGTSVREAWRAERTQLQPLPLLSEPFDVVVTRKVHRDCLVSFEGTPLQRSVSLGRPAGRRLGHAVPCRDPG
jgi:hypothetical protein